MISRECGYRAPDLRLNRKPPSSQGGGFFVAAAKLNGPARLPAKTNAVVPANAGTHNHRRR
ncbi:hypothetical protein BRAS3809_1720022 [Bradyrhizobium sp. STM 3809]|nr:hypothetical protein BRAS3809_1720022 [Bradyrhizobium sp. STM 3809]